MAVTAFTVLAPAPPHTLFVPGCFDGREGDRLVVQIGDGTVLEATVVDCNVFDRGRAVTITLDYDE